MKAYAFKINEEEFFMKKAIVILMVLSLVMAVSCVSAPAAAPAASSSLPPWINDVPPEDAIWGIGNAKMQDPRRNLNAAQARGRTSIARELDTKVQAMLTDYYLEAGGANTSLYEDVARQITNINVSGARMVNSWEDPKDGTLWVCMSYKKSDAKAAVASILKGEEAQYAQFKAQQAMDKMDAYLASSPVSSSNYVDRD
jgi:hypothetical protein